MALTVIGGSSPFGRHVVRSFAPLYSDIRLADMYPFREAVYRLQEEIAPIHLEKHALSYPTSLKLSLTGTAHLIVVTHDYFKLAHSKNFFVERAAFFAKELGVKKMTLVCPMAYDQLNPLDGDPAKLIKESESKAKSYMPSLSILRTNLIFGPKAADHPISYAIEAFSKRKPPLFPADGKAKFQPVHENEVITALKRINPGEEISISGPETLTWGEILTVLREFVGANDVTMGGGAENLRSGLARNKWIGDLFYSSQIQQMYWLLTKDRLPLATKTAEKRIRDAYPAGGFSFHREKYWWRVIVD